MRSRIIAAALVLAAVLLSGCGSNKPAPSPSPTTEPFSALQSEIALYADADVSEEDGMLLVALNIDAADPQAACEQFFHQAEDIFRYCLSGSEYGGVSFMLSVDGLVAGAMYLLPGQGGMTVLEPVAFNPAYEDALIDAFYDSAFAASLGG
jgi:hypothetical protein